MFEEESARDWAVRLRSFAWLVSWWHQKYAHIGGMLSIRLSNLSVCLAAHKTQIKNATPIEYGGFVCNPDGRQSTNTNDVERLFR